MIYLLAFESINDSPKIKEEGEGGALNASKPKSGTFFQNGSARLCEIRAPKEKNAKIRGSVKKPKIGFFWRVFFSEPLLRRDEIQTELSLSNTRTIVRPPPFGADKIFCFICANGSIRVRHVRKTRSNAPRPKMRALIAI